MRTLSFLFLSEKREEYKHQKPRGGISLQGAQVAPSDEDSVTFTIHAANSEVYRLRGMDYLNSKDFQCYEESGKKTAIGQHIIKSR